MYDESTSCSQALCTSSFQLATEKQMIDEMQDQLQIVEEVFAKTPELMDVLTHPKITIERKNSL